MRHLGHSTQPKTTHANIISMGSRFCCPNTVLTVRNGITMLGLDGSMAGGLMPNQTSHRAVVFERKISVTSLPRRDHLADSRIGPHIVQPNATVVGPLEAATHHPLRHIDPSAKPQLSTHPVWRSWSDSLRSIRMSPSVGSRMYRRRRGIQFRRQPPQ